MKSQVTKILLLSLVALGLSSCSETREERLGKVTKEYADAIHDLPLYEAEMEFKQQQQAELEEAIKYLGECVQCAPNGNHATINWLTHAISDLEDDLASAKNSYEQNKKKRYEAQFIILNYGKDSYFINALDTTKAELLEDIEP